MIATAQSVLLAGASGYIGRAVARALVEQGMEVIALARAPIDGLPDCRIVLAEVTDAASVRGALAGLRVDAVVSCIASRTGVAADAWRVDYQANRHLLDAGRRAGASRFVLLSAICVQRPRLAFQHAKLAFEAELADSGIDHSIVRPTAFFKSLSGQVARVRQGKPFLLFGDGTLTACKPISEGDLARFMVACLAAAPGCRQILPIGGPGEAITPRAQGELLFELAGMPPAFRHVPVRLFDVALAVLAPLGRLLPAAATKAELARIGRYYATESMLLWDPQRGCYDAGATPSTGTETLREHYARVLREGLAGHVLRDQKMF